MSGIDARDVIELSVRRELVGPEPGEVKRGEALDLAAGPVHFESWEAARGPWHDAATGEEILTEADPLRRYGVGVLYPQGTEAVAAGRESTSGIPGLPSDDVVQDSVSTIEVTPQSQPEADSDDFDLRDANSYNPSAMAVSFRLRIGDGQSLEVAATGASYEKIPVLIGTARRDWWLRRPMTFVANVSEKILRATDKKLCAVDATGLGESRVHPQVQVYSRPLAGDSSGTTRLVTIVLVNTTRGSGSAATLLQARFEVTARGGSRIEPYPDAKAPGVSDHEARSISLLYRNKRTFAIGHGCAAGWDDPPPGGTVAVVRAEPLPAYEVPSLTSEIFDVGGDGVRRRVQASMSDLAAGSAEGDRQLDSVLALYARWIEDRRSEVGELPTHHQVAANEHMRLCDQALERMKSGRRLLAVNSQARRAFQLANESMLFQQIRSRLGLREVAFDKAGILSVTGSAPAAEPSEDVGKWRPFQIAFLLASLEDVFDPAAENRSLVDLIFFPTGGGKTEAYLGAAAISMFARRLRNPEDAGTDVLMRYTLRLLTAQQFLRAASLLCVMEDIRSRTRDLGSDRFSIGIWLGSATTPNSWEEAKRGLAKLRKDKREENPFLLLRCPWCGAQMGPVPKPGMAQEAVGYVPVGSKVRFICPDRTCRYANRDGLPIHIVDEDIYETRPSLVIGTVDKFAMLAWRPDARGLFGLDEAGEREVSPPGLIIQDELHLISGPLGSMVGLYEPVIEDMCTDYRSVPPRKPKIIASTATIRQYERQIEDLYGRSKVALFPPHGLEEGRSFFAEMARLPDGSPAPGRRYLGIMSASLGSIQTVQVRVAASTLQGAMALPDADRDAYWTNLNFMNSLRELGNTVSLLQSDIPDYLTGMRKRDDLPISEIRWPRIVMELTGRRRSDEIPKAIEQLQLEYGRDDCVDVCLASNIIEVGVDIDRLSLMTIVGQPKTTAQYIQVSGRVGRRWWERPGLVATIYGAAKPRDRSHYERFRSYHQRLYAEVEPTSLTPFALPVVLRGLHGAVVAHVRQTSELGLKPDPFPLEAFERAASLIRDRAMSADPAELPALDAVIARRRREWGRGERTEWSANVMGDGDPLQGLMRYAGSSPEPGAKVPTIWDTPASMRTVDAECQLRITDSYVRDAVADPGELL